MSVNGHKSNTVQGIDISIVKLVPRSERKVAKKYRQRIEASLRAVGLIEQLVVNEPSRRHEAAAGECNRLAGRLDGWKRDLYFLFEGQ